MFAAPCANRARSVARAYRTRILQMRARTALEVEILEVEMMEATGGLEIPLAAALAAAALPVGVVNPRQVRDFAKPTGKLAEADTNYTT